MSVEIRPATFNDVPELYAISLKAHCDGYDAMIPNDQKGRFYAHYQYSPEREKLFIERYTERLKRPDWGGYVAVSAQAVVGYVLFRKLSEDSTLLSDLFIHPDHRGFGIGRKLFDAGLDAIDTNRIQLVVLSDNHRARSLYKTCGFQDGPLHPKFFYGAEQRIMTYCRN